MEENKDEEGNVGETSRTGSTTQTQGKNKGIVAPPKKKPIEHIPCLFLPHEEGGNKLCLYFHGNAEDIGLAFDLLYLFGQRMEMHVLAIEYPGYGLYKTSKPGEE